MACILDWRALFFAFWLVGLLNSIVTCLFGFVRLGSPDETLLFFVVVLFVLLLPPLFLRPRVLQYLLLQINNHSENRIKK